MKSIALLAAAALVAAAPASALTFDWSFSPVYVSNGVYGPITGTISGLSEGANAGGAVTVTVTTSPFAHTVGGGYSYVSSLLGGPAFVVTGGAVTFSDAYYAKPNANLFLGNGLGAYSPKLDIFTNPGHVQVGDANTGSGLTFTAVPTVVPEPAVWMTLLAGMALVGAALRGRKSRILANA